MTRELVASVVMDFLQKVSRPHPFKEKPGFDWWVGFLKRWPQLVERKPQHLSKRGLKEPTTKPFTAFLRGSRSSSVTLAFYMQMISLNDCGTVMKAACAMQLPLAESLQREALD